MQILNYYIATFGCQMNEHDSHMLAGLLDAAGYHEVGSAAEADLVVVNSCCIRESAEQKIRSYIGSLKQYVHDKPHFTVAVCGCMVQQKGRAEALSRLGEYVGILVGTSALGNLPAYVAEYAQNGKRIIDITEGERACDPTYIDKSIIKFTSSYKAEVSIIYGCNNFCSYCIVPYVRGRERSVEPQNIISAVQKLAQNGCREILLLGQNVNSYGKDLPDGSSFASLLRQVSAIDGIERIRYMSSHPRDITDELLDVIAAEDKICKHYHLPLQSGCDRLLKAMNRQYTCDDYYSIIEKIRAKVPEAVITTDLIMGFPGETDADFAETLDFVAKCRFDAAYAFIYSQRSGTVAAKMPDQIDLAVKKERLNRLAELQNPISYEINQKAVGSRQRILCEGKSHSDPMMQFGRTDGEKIVIFEPRQDAHRAQIDMTGQFVDVEITKANTWNFYGKLI